MARIRFSTMISVSLLCIGPALATPAFGQCDPGAPDTDCNANGIPDACEIMGLLTLSSGRLSPFDTASPQGFTLDTPPVSLEDLVLTVTANADVGHWSEQVEVWINDTPLRSVFLFSMDCADVTEMVFVPREVYAAAAASGSVTFWMIPNASVNVSQCGTSYVEASLELMTNAALDENANGIPDECEQDNATLCADVEPTIYVDEDGFIVGGWLDGLPYFGLLLGTRHDDVILGTDGRDIILGLQGDDMICAGDGRDFVHGHQGDDIIMAGSGNDHVHGQKGDDLIDAGEGRDKVHGGRGFDICIDGEKVRGCEG